MCRPENANTPYRIFNGRNKVAVRSHAAVRASVLFAVALTVQKRISSESVRQVRVQCRKII